ncbi:hypothetical protein Tco_0235937 [Tanacetum coccineum]
MEIYTNLQKKVLDLEKAKTAQDSEIASLKKRVKKLERRNKSRNPGLKSLRKVRGSARMVSSEDEGLGDQEDASKQGRKIANIDVDAEVTLIDETQERNDDNLMFDIGVLDETEVEVKKVVSTAEVEVTTASATITTIDELTLAQTLIKIKVAKPKAVITAATTTTITRPKARGVVVQEPNAKLEKEKIARQKEEDANIAEWDDVQAMMDADYELAAKLQAEEQGELTIEEKSRLFMELMNKRKKHFARLRAEEQRRKPPTKAQKRNIMSTYLKNMAGYKHNQLKTKSFEDIQMLFDKEMKRLEQEVAKKKKIDDDQDEAEMKKHMEIVPNDEVAINAIPLATKPPIIGDWKNIKEGKIGYFQIIRADGNSKRYSSMNQMLQNIDREDLESLWKLVKAKHGNTRLEEGYKKVLWGDLKVMFEPDVESEVWRNLQEHKVTVWKLFSSSGVHFVRFQNLHIFMLVEKRYPLTPATITEMLNKKLQTDHWNEMCYQLLNLMTKLVKNPGSV